MILTGVRTRTLISASVNRKVPSSGNASAPEAHTVWPWQSAGAVTTVRLRTYGPFLPLLYVRVHIAGVCDLVLLTAL